MMEGVVNVLKAPGLTSSDVVSDIRKIFGQKRVGHTGTLDPDAAGVLPICIGRATRLFDYLVDKTKVYIAEIRFGASTDTQDASGRVLDCSDKVVSIDMLQAVLPSFLGSLTQIAPRYSAVRVDGKKLYELARSGEEAPEKRREVTIHGIDILRELEKNRFLLRICCSKGTYIRTLCHDLGAALGVPAHMAFLLRTASGSSSLDSAYTLDELRYMKEAGTLETTLLPIEKAIPQVPELDMSALSNRKKEHLKNGASAPAEAQDGKYRVYVDGAFWGIGVVEQEELHIELNMILEPGRM